MSRPDLSPEEGEVLDLAGPYALHAVLEDERSEIERRVAAAPSPIAERFHAEVRSTLETMAELSALTAVEPPERIRDQLLETVRAAKARSLRWRYGLAAAAAAAVIAVAAAGTAILFRPVSPQPAAAQILASPDVRTVTGAIPSGGSATVLFSPSKHEAVLVMNDVAPPAPGTVYQMWLIKPGGPVSAGTMDGQAVLPSTTAVIKDLGDSTALAFTVEPPGGSTVPTGKIFAQLPLS